MVKSAYAAQEKYKLVVVFENTNTNREIHPSRN